MNQELHTGRIWFAYFLGFSLTLLFKWGKAVHNGKLQGKTMKAVTTDWFFEPSLENGSSWTATIGGVWVLGSIYINRIVNIVGLTDLPLHESFAFLLGSIFEVTVPNMVKWMVSKLPFK